MVMRESTSGEAQACREKALRHIERIRSTFKETTTDEERFQAFLNLFNGAAYGTGRCRENFENGNHCRWDNDKVTAKALYNSNREGVVLMQLVMEEMKPLISSVEKKPLMAVNGTSVAFMECCQKAAKAEADFEDTDMVYREKVLCDRQPDSSKPILIQKLEAVIAMIVAQFIFVPEGFLS